MKSVAVQMPTPAALTAELTKMRRLPANFTAKGLLKCKFCTKSNTLYQLYSGQVSNGSWCPDHGWLSFDSVKCPPTERLTVDELAEHKQSEQRRQRAINRV